MPTDRDHATLRARVQAQIAAQQARIATSQAYRRQRPPRRPLPLALVALLVALTLGGGAFGSPPAAAATWQSAGTLPGDYSPGAGAVLLADGRVLVVSRERAAISTRDADTWTALPDRKYGAGTLLALQDGGALLVGGAPTTFANDPYAPTRQVVRLDPRTGTWVKGNDMPDGRGEHTLTTLRDGTILVVGGSGGSLSPRQPIATLAQVGRYDPAIDAWTALAPLAQARSRHTATLLPDGRVLVVGGAISKTVNSENAGSDPLASAEIFSPAANTWQAAGQLTAERYDPQANGWTSAGTVGPARVGFATTLLLDGAVLVTGGVGLSSNLPIATTTLYTPSTNSWQASATLPASRAYHGAVLLNGAVLLLGGLSSAGGTSTARYDATPADTVCYSDTGRCIGGAFRTYWQGHGQLPINGYPLSSPFPEQLEDGKVYLVQYFERVRLEAHPEQPAPYDVLLGQFGRRIHPVDPAVAPQAADWYFVQTGHNINARFTTYWSVYGGVTQFGYPLTETLTETLEDGKQYQVQYFERARFEYHPENPNPYMILLGQFGRRILAGR